MRESPTTATRQNSLSAACPIEPGVAYQILGPISDAHINVDIILQNVSAEDGTANVTFTVHRNDYQKAFNILNDIASRLGATEVVGDDKIAKVAVVGVGMRSHAGIASKMFGSTGGGGINIQMISTSEIKISVVVEDKYMELAVRTLHKAFGLDSALIPEDQSPDLVVVSKRRNRR